MNRRNFALLAALMIPFLASGEEPTASFDVEILPAKEEADSNRTPESDAKWFRRVLSEGAGFPKEKIQTEITDAGRVRITTPKSIAPQVGTVLEYLATNPRLGFYAVHPKSGALAADVADGKKVIPGYRALPYGQDHVLITMLPAVSGDSVESAEAKKGPQGDWSVSVSLDRTGAAAMKKTTTKLLGKPLAIVLGDRVISTPLIRQPFSSGCLISGNFTESETVSLAAFIGDPPPFTFKVKPSP